MEPISADAAPSLSCSSARSTTRRRRPRQLAAAAVLSAVGLTGSAASASVSAPHSPITASVSPAAAPSPYVTVEGTLVYQVNRHRRNHGLAPVTIDWRLTLAAVRHSNDMSVMRRMTHTGSDGSNAGQRITRAGFRWRAWGENVAAGYDSTAGVMYGWMTSPGHRANILNRSFRYIGAYCKIGSGTYWWTMVFAT